MVDRLTISDTRIQKAMQYAVGILHCMALASDVADTSYLEIAIDLQTERRIDVRVCILMTDCNAIGFELLLRL
jgi:hypothetical protein